MVFDVSVVLTWILFLALFPMAFLWLRRAWRIGVKRDYSEVALKRGESPPEPARWALWELLINLAAGCAALVAIAGVVSGLMPYGTWTAIAGTTIWCKIFASFGLARHAHLQSSRAARR
jgi:ABC-type Fe3+ transport system permease subunit